MKLALTILFFIFVIACSSNTESETGTTNPPDTTTPTPGKATFDSKIAPLLTNVNKCAPCHTNGGQQANFESFSTAKSKITEIIKRVELSPSDPGFMPKNRSKLSTSEIDQLKAWSSELSGS